jgi:hypothetical protein
MVVPSIAEFFSSFSNVLVSGYDVNPDALVISAPYAHSFQMPMVNDQNYIDHFIEKSSHLDFYFPMIDEELWLSLKNDRLYEHLHLKGYEIKKKDLSNLVDKGSFTKICIEEGFLPDPKQSKKICVKPKFGRGSRSVIMVEDPELKISYQNLNTFVVQPFIDGEEYTVDCFNPAGCPKPLIIPRRRFSANSVSTSGQVVKSNTIFEIVKKLISIFNLSGIFNVQGILANHTFYPIEINPRLSGSSIFCDMSGVPYLEAIIKNLNSGVMPTPFNPHKDKSFPRIERKYIIVARDI